MCRWSRALARLYAERARRLLRRLGASWTTVKDPPGKLRRARRAGRPLSAREIEIAHLVAKGLTTAEIAAKLVISPRTVTTHLDHIYTRLDLGSRVALARYVTEAGLLTADDKNT